MVFLVLLVHLQTQARLCFQAGKQRASRIWKKMRAMFVVGFEWLRRILVYPDAEAIKFDSSLRCSFFVMQPYGRRSAASGKVTCSLASARLVAGY